MVNITQVDAACMATRKNQGDESKACSFQDPCSSRDTGVEQEEQACQDEAKGKVDGEARSDINRRPGKGRIRREELPGRGICVDETVHEGKEEAGGDTHQDIPLHGEPLA
jgi:hypothetical protein